jgi:hypothetical protein
MGFYKGFFMSDATTKERTENVVIENVKKYETIDKKTAKRVINEILVEYAHVFEELAK